jgi:hypothetical protein
MRIALENRKLEDWEDQLSWDRFEWYRRAVMRRRRREIGAWHALWHKPMLFISRENHALRGLSMNCFATATQKVTQSFLATISFERVSPVPGPWDTMVFSFGENRRRTIHFIMTCIDRVWYWMCLPLYCNSQQVQRCWERWGGKCQYCQLE